MENNTISKTSKYKIANKLLLAIIVLCNMYVLIAPLLPHAELWVDTTVTKPVKVNVGSTDSLASLDRVTNRLIIPSLQFEQPVLEGPNEGVLLRGIWRRPQTSTPDKESNTVIVGHRFSYRDNRSFYHLDKVQMDEKLIVVWEKKIYVYTVSSVTIVAPNAIEVEAATNDARLTLYTCTPLWTAKQRLVITSRLERVIP